MAAFLGLGVEAGAEIANYILENGNLCPFSLEHRDKLGVPRHVIAIAGNTPIAGHTRCSSLDSTSKFLIRHGSRIAFPSESP
jgi:hypothetical protein